MGHLDNLIYEDFKSYIAEHLKEYLPPEYADAEITFEEITKNNGKVMDAVVIKSTNTNIFPTIYLKDLFKEHEEGLDMNQVLERIKDTQLEYAVDETMNVKAITDFENIKDKIIPRLVNAKANEEALKDMPHTVMDDLAVIYTISLSSLDDAMATVTIKNAHFDMFDISVEDLHKLAVNNLEAVSKPKLLDLGEMLASTLVTDFDGMSETEKKKVLDDVMPSDNPSHMYVITNEKKMNGASSFLDDKIMEKAKEILGDFYILPSSIHELILIPKDENTYDISELEKLINEVNVTQVDELDFLSDHVYEYDSENKELYRASMREEHFKAKEESKEKDISNKKEVSTEKKSVKEAINSKKKDANSQNSKLPSKSKEKNRKVAL